ncbi:hypothetical protein [Deinococcus radiophilus]|uniref:hypothetical protein n=1 Tax=Deinococcus radiophilus TaxID=32062 RepID=UPI00361B76E8
MTQAAQGFRLPDTLDANALQGKRVGVILPEDFAPELRQKVEQAWRQRAPWPCP